MAMKRSGLTGERNEENLRILADRVRHWNEYCSSIDEQQVLLQQVSEFFAPEIKEAMDYTDKLPSFRNCGGIDGRRELLRQEAELIIWTRLLLGEEGAKDFDTCIQGFRDAINETLNEYHSAAQRESVSVTVAQNRKRDSQDKCAVVSHGKDITEEIEARQTLSDPAVEAESTLEDFMDDHLGPYKPFGE